MVETTNQNCFIHLIVVGELQIFSANLAGEESMC